MRTLSRRDSLRLSAAAVAAPALTSWLASPAAAAPTQAQVKAVVDKAAAFLKSKQKADGDLAPDPRVGPGMTALAVGALLRNGYGPTDPVVEKGLKFLEGSIKPDGGVYSKGLATYTTSLALVAFKEANAGGKYDKVIDNATRYLKSLQYGDGLKPDNVEFGGAGYDQPGAKGGRPDLSNTHFMIEALLSAGVPKDDPAIKNALAFVSRCQNLPGEYQDQPFAAKATDDDKGGLVYNPTNPGKDSPKATPAGGLRSEGGMTYAGLKSFLYAGVSKDDPRVKAAVNWVRRHWTVDENPGMGQAGLYYYYHTLAKAMDALGEESFADAKGTKHDWRQELFDALAKRQKPDGSWANDNRAFLENAPELATAFAILALSYTVPKKG